MKHTGHVFYLLRKTSMTSLCCNPRTGIRTALATNQSIHISTYELPFPGIETNAALNPNGPKIPVKWT